MKYKIYVDMDGVTCDFERKIRDYGKDVNNITDAELWGLVKIIPNFWEELEWMPYGKEIWDLVKDRNPTILTSPSHQDKKQTERAKKGKLIWVERELGTEYPVLFERSKDKKIHARPNAILIDDLESNILGWREKGGIGIHQNDPIYVIKQLKRLL